MQAGSQSRREAATEAAVDEEDDLDAVRLAFISLIAWHLPC